MQNYFYFENTDYLKIYYSGHVTGAVWIVLPFEKVQTEKNSWFEHHVGELISLVLPLLRMVHTSVIVLPQGIHKKTDASLHEETISCRIIRASDMIISEIVCQSIPPKCSV